MCRLCSELARSYDREATLNILARNIRKIMGVKGATIRILDEKNQTLEIVAQDGLSKSYLKKGPVILKRHPIDQKVLKGKTVGTRDITKEPHVLYIKDAKKEGIKSVLSVPFISDKRTIGVVRVYTSHPHDFSKEEVERLKVLASFGGIIVDRARIWNEMRALIRISQSISSTLSLDSVLQMIVENAIKILGIKAASILLLDEDRKVLKVRAAHGLSPSYREGSVTIGNSRLDRACLTCKMIPVKDVRKDKRLPYRDELVQQGIVSMLSLPLTVRGTSIGILKVFTSVPYTFNESETDFLSALACQGAIAIENARLFEHIRSEYKELARDVWKWYDWGKHFPKI